MKNRSLISIIFISLVIFIGLLFSVYKVVTKDATYFYANGYVSMSDSEVSDKIYFTQGTSYKKGYNNEIIFKDDEDNKQNVSKYSFVFYDDKTIGYLADGVLMDLNGLDSNFTPYYNIKSNYLIKFNSNKYVIESTDKNIILDNFIGKIDENKYLIAGNDLKLKLSSSDTFINGYYFELIFLEGNIVKINNQEVNIETISDECYILAGDNVKIDLSKQAIFYKDAFKANLTEIIINNDENIDILYKEEVKEEDEGQGGAGGEGGGTGNGGTGGDGAGNEDYIVETVIEYKNIPYVEVISSSINSHKLNLKFNVIDKHGLITGPVTVRYLNLKTSEVFTKEYDVYDDTIDFTAENMMSDTNYVVTISASYVRNANIYKDYIMFQRTFSTADLGVELAKDYVTSKEISYNINFANSSTFQGGQLNLYNNKGELVESYDFTNNHQPINVIFSDLNSNASYTAKIENIRYGNVTYTSGFAALVQTKTLKHNPFKDNGIVASPVVTTNKIDYIFTFDLGLINDRDKSIKEVEYRVYEKDTNKLVKTIKRSDINSIEVAIDEDIQKSTTYYFNAVITLNDNEKVVYYQTLNSNDFNMDNKIIPTVRFESGEVSANTIYGDFIITDPDGAIDKTKEIYVQYVNSLGELKTKNLTYGNCASNESATTKCVHVDIVELTSDDNYTLNLMAYVDLNDEELEPGVIQIGAIKIHTQKADIIKTDLSANELPETDEDLFTKVFEVNVGLALGDETAEIIRDNMERFDIMLYEGKDASGSFLGTIHIDSTSNDIVKDFFEGVQTYTLEDFGLTLEDLVLLHASDGGKISKSYTIRLTNGKSGENYVEFRPSFLTFEINEVLLDISNNGATISVSPILNNPENPKYDATLNEDTIIGLSIQPEFKNKKYVHKINYIISDVTDAENITTLPLEFAVSLDENSVIEPTEIYFTDYPDFMRRGRVYRVEYTISLDLNGDNKTDRIYPFDIENINEAKPVVSGDVYVNKQAPSVVIFPWTSDINSISYKYKVIDIDGAFVADTALYYEVNGHDAMASSGNCANVGSSSYTSDYLCAGFDNLNPADVYSVYLKAQLIERPDSFERVDINSYTFEGNVTLDTVSINLITDETGASKYNNIVAIKLSDSNQNALINRIAKYTVKLAYDNRTFTIDNIIANKGAKIKNTVKYTHLDETVSGNITSLGYVSQCEGEPGSTCIYIDYSLLYLSNTFGSYFKKFQNQNIELTISALYDTGKIGYLANRNNRYSFQIVSSEPIENYTNKYLIYSGPSAFMTSASALSAAYLYASNKGGFVDDGFSSVIYVDNELGNINPGTIDYMITRRGVEVSIGTVVVPIVAKELGDAQINGNVKFSYDQVVPVIGLNNLVSTINGLKFNYQLNGVTDADITSEDGNRYFYIEVYSKDSNNLVKTLKINKNEFGRQTGEIQNGKYIIKTVNANYKVDVRSVAVNGSAITDYSYNYRTGEIKLNGNYADGSRIDVTYSYVIDKLDVGQSYSLKAFVKMGNNGTKKYLADINSQTYADFVYEFTTKKASELGIAKATFTVDSSTDYKHRYLVTTYDINDIVGIDDLKYEICNKEDLCVNASNGSAALSLAYNTLGDTYFAKNSNVYNAAAKYDISYSADYDFLFNTNYTLKITALVNDSQEFLIYDSSLKVDALRGPKVTVEKSSHVNNANGLSDYYLKFGVGINDPDRVVKDGKYTVWLATGINKKEVAGTRVSYDVIQNGSNKTQEFEYHDLQANTDYYLMVEYETYTNNQGTANPSVTTTIPYLIYTLNNHNVSIGRYTYTPNSNGTTTLKLGYASNIVQEQCDSSNNNCIEQEGYVAGIVYTIARTSGSIFKIDGHKIFNPGEIIYVQNDTSENELGENYYQIVLQNTNYPDDAMYAIEFNFYLGGKIVPDNLNTYEACMNDSITNCWHVDGDETGQCALAKPASAAGTCYILDGENTYTDESYVLSSQNGGAQ